MQPHRPAAETHNTIEGDHATLPFPLQMTETGSDHTDPAPLADFTSDLFPVSHPRSW